MSYKFECNIPNKNISKYLPPLIIKIQEINENTQKNTFNVFETHRTIT